MLNSRKIEDLLPKVAKMCEAFLAKCKVAGIDVLVTSTFRDYESQQALYNQGRTTPGKKVTNAPAGYSWHNFRCAFDVVPLRNGKPVWGTTGADLKLWKAIGAIGESVGLEWGGNWEGFLDYPHFQYDSGLTLAELRAGKKIL
jgi:peptidoglycan L-alanyl-D-glutamate endopeptidase CwlK